MQPPGRVEHQHVCPAVASRLDCIAADLHRRTDGLAVLGDTVALGIKAYGRAFHLIVDLAGEDLELIDRGRALQIGRHQHALRVLLFQERGQLAAGGGLARTLKATHHDHRRTGRDLHHRLPGSLVGPHQLDQFVVDDLDHLLAGLEALKHLGAEGFCQHRLNK